MGAKRVVSLVVPEGAIADVGCGNCALLKELNLVGFHEMYGVDQGQRLSRRVLFSGAEQIRSRSVDSKNFSIHTQ